MKIKVELELDQWNYIIEVLDLNEKIMIKQVALDLLRPQVQFGYDESLKPKDADTESPA